MNHLFHDAASFGMLASGSPLSAKVVPPRITKMPPQPPFTPAPTRVTSLTIDGPTVAVIKRACGVETRNEVAFLLSLLSISRAVTPASVMCLHNAMPRRDRTTAGGDFSCLSEPLEVPSGITPGEAAALAKGHLSELRSGRGLVTDTASAPVQGRPGRPPLFVFDTLVGSGMGSPEEGEVTIDASLTALFSHVLRDFVMVYDVGDSLQLTMYSDRAQLSEDILATLCPEGS